VGKVVTWDAVVIGAGPAGSVAARELARRGLTVRLVDKATFPRPKVCGCCLNRAALAALDAVGLGHIPTACGAVPLHAVRVAAGRVSATLALPGGVALSRAAFDAVLVREAVAAGVTFESNTRLNLDDALASARVVVVASGLGGVPSKAAPSSRVGAGAITANAPDFFAPGTIYMATGGGGYVGLVRLEDGRLDLAAALDAQFVKAAGGVGAAASIILKATDWPPVLGLTELPWKGTRALTHTPRAIAGGRWFAVGDAAGYVEPFTGEGMAWAVASAAAVGPLAERAVSEWTPALAAEWKRTHARVIGRRQRVCHVVARVLRHPVVTGVAVRALGVVPALARPVVALLNRPVRSERSLA
jgi:flavin-dependent dehydrogenase